jgi:hypothetical protein
MPIRKRFLGISRNIDDVYLRIRLEVYAYWLGSPRRLIGNNLETSAQKLTGVTLEKLISTYLMPDDSRRLLEIIRCLGMMDKTTCSTLKLKSAVAVKLIQEPDFDSFYNWFVLEVKKYK